MPLSVPLAQLKLSDKTAASVPLTQNCAVPLNITLTAVELLRAINVTQPQPMIFSFFHTFFKLSYDGVSTTDDYKKRLRSYLRENFDKIKSCKFYQTFTLVKASYFSNNSPIDNLS